MEKVEKVEVAMKGSGGGGSSGRGGGCGWLPVALRGQGWRTWAGVGLSSSSSGKANREWQ